LRCLESGECIHEMLVCDGHVDCADGSDEWGDVCDDSLFAPGLVYKGYLASGQTCFIDARRMYIEFQYNKVVRLPHLPQAVFTSGTLGWRYKWINGSETYETKD
ncbi:unnamed protein product, partial [Owenia fusiformis]